MTTLDQRLQHIHDLAMQAQREGMELLHEPGLPLERLDNLATAVGLLTAAGTFMRKAKSDLDGVGCFLIDPPVTYEVPGANVSHT